jgi:AAA family ATP:ADP antiporter
MASVYARPLQLWTRWRVLWAHGMKPLDYQNPTRIDHDGSLIARMLRRAVEIGPGELAPVAWAWLYIFLVMCAYSMLRPIRDDMGVESGIENLPWLFMATLAGMMAINPVFSALVARLPRATFIAIAYSFFALNLILFAWLLYAGSAKQNIWIGRAFFVWLSIFNLFVVSVFWGLMADVFDPEQGKRLFGVIASGMSLGAIAGAGLTSLLAPRIHHAFLLAIAAVMLESAVFIVSRLHVRERASSAAQITPVGGSFLAGIQRALSSPYLLNVSLFMLVYSITSTFLYFQQAEIAKTHFADRGARTAFFAQVDLAVNTLTLLAQLFVTARVMRALGVAATLAFLPALTAVGFGALAFRPLMAVLVAFLVLRRAGNFALARPAREVLFTVLPREDKYKAKSFIDTVVYRTGDQVGAWSYTLLGWLGLTMTGIAIVAVPLSLAWLVNALWLGRKQESISRLVEHETPRGNHPVIPRSERSAQ